MLRMRRAVHASRDQVVVVAIERACFGCVAWMVATVLLFFLCAWAEIPSS
jgi:hypothetical protein